ncbi:hypothetical protein REPUB_Repub06bG0212300 [Reevesia pubescens]
MRSFLWPLECTINLLRAYFEVNSGIIKDTPVTIQVAAATGLCGIGYRLLLAAPLGSCNVSQSSCSCVLTFDEESRI